MLDDVDLFQTILLYRFKKIQRVRALRGKTKHYSEGGNFFIDLDAPGACLRGLPVTSEY